MSPKTPKSKKEWIDSKRTDSKIEAGSAPFSKLADEPDLPGFGIDDSPRKSDPDLSYEETDDLQVPPLRQDSHDKYDGRKKATVYFDDFAKMIIKVFSQGKQVMVFPMLAKYFMDRRGYFSSLRSISNCICDMIDSELERQRFHPFFTKSFDHEYGFACDMRIESHDPSLCQDFYLHERNYEDLFFSTYVEKKSITLHIHVNDDILKPIDNANEHVKKEDDVVSNLKSATSRGNDIKEENPDHDNHPVMFRGRPIDLNADNKSPMYHPSTPRVRPNHASDQGHVKSTPRKSSPISVYDDGDYLVQDPDNIYPFGQQSIQQRIADIQAAAVATIPDVTTLPKLLKSHNVGFKEGDNAATWYSRFNDFCLMIGIYLPPPNAMRKDSEMGKEWDSNALPYVFYSRLAKMDKVLSHILQAPDFFPKSMSDELQLNPKPYNFLRLFMALRSNSVPELSDRIVKRPDPMKMSQTLAQYALSWVNYFTDESNVNGIEYSKFRQYYCYFVDGISGRYTSIKKFLEMEFTRSHDRKNNIPISLELRNLPTTITSLCNVHGISLSHNAVHSLSHSREDPSDNCCKEDVSSIKKVHFEPKLQGNTNATSTNKQQGGKSTVQCWLCDGSHSFRQCDELVRMKNICAKHPQVQKHFRQLLLKKNIDGIKMILDAPDIFDDEFSTDQSQDGHDAQSDIDNETTDIESQNNVNSLKVLDSATFTTLRQGIQVSDVTDFSRGTQSTLQITDEHELDVDPNDFYVLSLSDYEIDSFDFLHLANDIEDIAQLSPQYDAIAASTLDDELIICSNSSLDISTFDNDDAIHSVSFDRISSSQDASHVRYNYFTTQVDGGADRCTTPHRTLVDNMRKPNPTLGEPTYILDAGKHRHKVEGVGNFRIETIVDGKANHTLTIPCVYIPTIPSTLVNFRLASGAIMYGEVSNLVTHEAVGTLIVGTPDNNVIHKIPLKIRGQRVYASNILSCDSFCPNDDDCDSQVAIVSDEATRLLWHARLGHLNFRALSSMHLSATGIPKFKQSHVLDQCETCLETKLRRSPRGHGTIQNKAEVHGQILCADWGYICQNSTDPTRLTRLSSVHGDTSYLIFACAHTGALYGVCAGSKSVPTKWLHTFLHRISHSIGSRAKTVLVDRGSELGRSNEFRKITELHGYKPITSGPDKSSMNSLGERPHSTIGNALRSMLHASGLDLKYWNFAFYHFIRLFNFFPHGKRTKSPFELIRGHQPDLSLLRVFGCNVYIRPPGRRHSKLDKHVIRGKFLGYTSTMKQIYYLEETTNKIKVAAYARFDEGLANVPLQDLPPYARQLRKALGHSVPPPDDVDVVTPQDLDLLSSPELFPITFSHSFVVKSSDIVNEFDTLGFILKEDPLLRRCYIADISPRSTAAQYPRWRSQLIGAFILLIDDYVVYDRSDTEAALSRYLVELSSSSRRITVDITFAHDRSMHRAQLDPNNHAPSPIQMDQICHLTQIYETGEEIKYNPILDKEWFQYFDDLTANLPPSIHKTSTSQFTRAQLSKRDDFDLWQAAEFKQYDTHESDKMFGEPCPRPPKAIVLRSVWTYIMKKDGTRKARQCGDGRPLRDDKFRRLEAIYTACVSQVGVKMFFALSALNNYIIFDLDAVNAFGQAGGLFHVVYMEIDKQYRDWYFARKRKTIPNGWVLPVTGSLQGHPDSGEVWQGKINDIINSYNFHSTTHEPCLYRGTYQGQDMLICRQVDDMLLAGKDERIVKNFAMEISQKLKITYGSEPSKQFNGLDIIQTREGVKIHCKSYIDKLRRAHGWNEISNKPLEPISPSKVKELEDTIGPHVDSKEGVLLQKQNGFNYRGVIGEIVYAYIVARPDFGFAVGLLSRFNTCPAQCHYDAAKRCLKSLIRTADDGIWYWRREPRNDLPSANFIPRPIEEFEQKYPILDDPYLVSGMCDVSLAPNILMRRSFGGTYVFLGGVALILYLAKLQPTVVTSIGEGEFIQLVLTGKKIKYTRQIMDELGYKQTGPSPIFGDNISSIMMGKNIRPTDRTRHMDIKWFALQEWIHIDKDIILIHIAGDLNSSDSLTKALPWIKHYRHTSRAMGATGPVYLCFNLTSQRITSQSIKVLFIDLS